MARIAAVHGRTEGERILWLRPTALGVRVSELRSFIIDGPFSPWPTNGQFLTRTKVRDGGGTEA